MRLNDWKREAERFEDIDRAVLREIEAERDPKRMTLPEDEERPTECPSCHGPMDDSPRWPVCPSCRAAREADRAYDMGQDND